MGRPTQQVESQDNSNSKQSTVEPKKRRKTENLEGNDKDWEYLEQTLNQKIISNVDSSHSNNDPNALLFPHIPLIFFSLHLIYEEMKLDELLKNHLPSLAEVLHFPIENSHKLMFFISSSCIICLWTCS